MREAVLFSTTRFTELDDPQATRFRGTLQKKSSASIDSFCCSLCKWSLTLKPHTPML